jgi:hypothetical protein
VVSGVDKVFFGDAVEEFGGAGGSTNSKTGANSLIRESEFG